MKKKEKTVYGLIGSILLLVLFIGVSYSYIKLNKEEKETNILGTDCIKLEMEEESEAITLHHAYPVTDEVGKESQPYTFRLTNQCGVGVDYEIHLRVEEVEDGQKRIDAKNIATSVDENAKVLLTNKVNNEEDPEKEEYKINSDNLTLKPYETVEHKVRIWLDEDAGNDTQNGTFKSKVVIEAVQNQVAIYKEEILNGADPVLYDTTEEPLAMLTAVEEPTTSDILVPVKIDQEGKVTKADVTTEWYKYEDKKWANAVILVDNEKAKTLKAGDTINEEDIESYFVWIPKYKYKIFDMGDYKSLQVEELTNKAKAIEIEFGIEDTKDDQSTLYKQCKTPGTSGESGQCHVGDWMTHPAFTAFPNSKGMWVGKFETGYKQTEDLSNMSSWNVEGAKSDEQEPTKIIIKPNVFSWRSITIGNAYHTSYEYERELDSHMMKNTEWGAVAYLSHSKYGTCDENSCKKIRINNSSNLVTGYAAKNEPTTGIFGSETAKESMETNQFSSVTLGQDSDYNYNYKSKSSAVASTTGNYTGIYDMAGGAYEYVMGYMNKQVGNSGLSESTELIEINARYFDNYKIVSGEVPRYIKRILGDATGELGPFQEISNATATTRLSSWYKQTSYFVYKQSPWFIRGGGYYDGIYGGIFKFGIGTGELMSVESFRIVLTPTSEAM